MSKSIQLKNINNEKIYPHPYYPVGSIYLSVNDTNPSQWFGGKWEQIAKGRTLVGVDTSDTDFNTVKKTGGEKKHTLTINEMASHTHGSKSLTGSFYAYDYTGIRGTGIVTERIANPVGTGFGENTSETPWKGFTIDATHEHNNIGGNQAHNNLPPYFTCYIWCRTA